MLVLNIHILTHWTNPLPWLRASIQKLDLPEIVRLLNNMIDDVCFRAFTRVAIVNGVDADIHCPICELLSAQDKWMTAALA